MKLVVGRLAVVMLSILVLSACAEGGPASQPASTSNTPAGSTTDQTPPSAVPTAAAVAADDGNASNTDTTPLPERCAPEDPLPKGRTDVLMSGNRVAPGGIDLLRASMMTVDLPAPATWVVPSFSNDDPCGAHWYVALADGQAVVVDAAGQVSDAGPAVTPPESSEDGLTTAHHDLERFENPLPDGRVVTFGEWSAALVDPTDRYGHGVLGDRIEAGAIEVINSLRAERTRITVEPPSVIEGISPMLVDVDDDGRPEILVTQSNADVGAWLALYNIDGTLRAESDPIGRGNRWRNQLGAGFVGPNGEFEIVDVRTPHLDGVVEFFRVQGDRLTRVASTTGYTTHVIGSRNLDMGIMVDADADKLVEVLIPTRDLTSLTVIERVGEEAVETARIELDSKLTTNLATQWIAGQSWLALGTNDGRLLIWGDPL